jgi:hypothetical protein
VSRVYGLHIFVAGGDLDVTLCHFWNSAILLPVTDQIVYGGDTMVLGGNVQFISVMHTSTCYFQELAVFGANVYVAAGTATFIFTTVQVQNLFSVAAGPGQVYMVGGKELRHA